MKLHFISKTLDKLRKVYSKILTVITEEMAIQTEIDSKRYSYAPPFLNAEKTSEESPYVKQLRYLLIRNEEVAGKPFRKKSPEIRIIYVDSFTGAFIYFLRLCDQRLLTYLVTGNHLHCLVEFPDGSGKLSFSDKVKCRNKSVVALLKMEVPGLNPKISEIRFEVKQLKSNEK